MDCWGAGPGAEGSGLNFSGYKSLREGRKAPLMFITSAGGNKGGDKTVGK